MSQDVWISSVISNHEIGNKVGLRQKYAGEPWEAPYERHIVPPPSEKLSAALWEYSKGYSLDRSQFPEASAVYDWNCFKRKGDLFTAGPFYAVNAKLAEVLSRFDLGEGGLISYPIYEADEVTLVKGEFFLLNFGARKTSFLPEESRAIEPLYVDKQSGDQVWKVKAVANDGDIAVSPAALEGADLWFEQAIRRKIFMSDELVAALRAAKVNVDFKLNKCRIVGPGE